MPQFAYRARRRSGETVQGVLEVPDRTAALAQIERLGLFPIKVDASKGGVAAVAEAERPGGKRDLTALFPPAIRNFLQRKRKPKLQELATFTTQLANLLNSGMPLTVALNSMTHLTSKGIPAEVSKQLKQEVMEGKSLSNAMAQQPHVFSDLYINMVRAGEQSGSLVEVLRRLANHFERFAEVQSKFTSALIYPAFVVTAGIIIMFLFMTKMLPTFMEIFSGMNIELPLPTRILIKISYIFSHFWWAMILTVIIVAAFIRRFQASEEGKRKIDQWKMTAPVFGLAVRLNLFGQFARTLATLLENGVPVLTALQITEQIVPNRIVKEAIAKTRSDVTDGKTLAQPLARSKIFPQLMVDLVKIGEETGNVPGSLQNIADTYESELATALKVMTSMIEPVMIVVMSLVVAFLLVSILSAMFAMTSNIAK
ncbi:MAG TPA: type II secretion system F family protein [Verrucomicrobiae bacterium]|jgi:type II secretory pathway component PulF|nr:type II secretion system F family protein [Verrucomicrobiae bacterium]